MSRAARTAALSTAAAASRSFALGATRERGAATFEGSRRAGRRKIILGNNFHRMSWLFKLVDAHMPSVYLRLNIKEEDRTGFVKGRVTEAMRMAAKCQCKQQVLPYFWFKYQDKRDEFLTQVSSFRATESSASRDRQPIEMSISIFRGFFVSLQKDVKYTIKTIAQVGADGMIIWGSSEDTNTEWKCKDLHAYVTDVLGPAVKSFVTE